MLEYMLFNDWNQYVPLFEEFHIEPVCENVSFSMINFEIEFWGLDLENQFDCPVGILSPNEDYWGWWGADLQPLLPVGAISFDPVRNIGAMFFGLLTWHVYKLKLAMQLSKLTMFGRRGR